jgi:hypothetical protein
MSFEVISEDIHGQPTRCSYCSRGAPRVVVLPLVDRPAFDNDGAPPSPPSDEAWLGVCAYCVLDMAKALQKAEGTRT